MLVPALMALPAACGRGVGRRAGNRSTGETPRTRGSLLPVQPVRTFARPRARAHSVADGPTAAGRPVEDATGVAGGSDVRCPTRLRRASAPDRAGSCLEHVEVPIANAAVAPTAVLQSTPTGGPAGTIFTAEPAARPWVTLLSQHTCSTSRTALSGRQSSPTAMTQIAGAGTYTIGVTNRRERHAGQHLDIGHRHARHDEHRTDRDRGHRQRPGQRGA